MSRAFLRVIGLLDRPGALLRPTVGIRVLCRRRKPPPRVGKAPALANP